MGGNKIYFKQAPYKKHYPEQFNLNGVYESNRNIIANNSNKYFTNIGEELASKITDPVGKSHTLVTFSMRISTKLHKYTNTFSPNTYRPTIYINTVS